jgi:hypothetical protein
LVVSAGNLVDNPNLAEFYYRTIPTANAYVKLQNITQGYSFGGAWFRIKNSSQPVLWDNNVPNNTDAYIQNAFWGTSTNVGDAYLISGWKNNGTYKGRIFGNGNASFAGTLTAAGTDSVGTPLNTLWMDALGTIHKGVIPGGGGSGSDTTRSHWFYNGSDTFSIIPTGSGGGGNTTIKTYSGSTIGTLTIDASTIQIVRNNPLFRFQDNVVGAVSTIQNTGYKLAFDGSAGFENFQFNKPIHGLHGGSYDARYDVNAGSFIFNYNGFSSQADPFSFVVTGSTGALGSWYGGTDSRPYSFKIFNNGYAGFGLGSVSAQVHLPGSTTTAGTSALKFTAGSPPTTPETGSMNFNTGLWIIDSSTSVRDTIATRSWARNNISGGSSTNIYNTDGTLTGNRALSGGGNSLDLGTTGSKISTLTANLSADFNVVAAGAISLSPGSSNTVTLGGSSSGVRLQGDVALSSLQTATDANASLTNKTSIILPDITANRTLQFLTVTTGSLIVVFNRNTTGNTWSITGSVTIKDASGSTITNLVNNTVYILLYDGSNLIKIN